MLVVGLLIFFGYCGSFYKISRVISYLLNPLLFFLLLPNTIYFLAMRMGFCWEERLKESRTNLYSIIIGKQLGNRVNNFC